MQRISALAATLLSIGLSAFALGQALATPTPPRAPSATASVLEAGGRTLRFSAAPITLTQFTLPFEAGNALLLKEASQRLRQPDLGPFVDGGGAVMHLVTVSAPDAKLAFERARTIRAELVRLGVAEPRALAAAAGEPAATTASAPAALTDTRVEEATVRILRLTRASCHACGPTTLGAFALDTAAVRMARLALPGAAEPPDATSQARSADRTVPDGQLSFQDRPALALRETPAAVTTAAAPPARAAGRDGLPQADQEVRAAHSAKPPARALPPTAEAVRMADLRALGGLPQRGCRATIRPIDDYGPHPRVWTCPVR
jgi:hypothetical protein